MGWICIFLILFNDHNKQINNFLFLVFNESKTSLLKSWEFQGFTKTCFSKHNKLLIFYQQIHISRFIIQTVFSSMTVGTLQFHLKSGCTQKKSIRWFLGWRHQRTKVELHKLINNLLSDALWINIFFFGGGGAKLRCLEL